MTAVRVDGDGNVIATLGSTTTDTKGHYRLTLPSGTTLAPTILLRVQGSGIELRAPAVQLLVDINPASEWLLQELNTEGATLDSLSNDDLLFLQAVLESYTVDAGGTVAATLANLAPLRAMMVAEIAAVQASSATPPSFNGTWVLSGNDIMVGNVSSGDVNGVWISGQWINTLSDYTATLSHAGGNLYNATISGIESETSQYAHGSTCVLSVTPPYVSDCTFESYNKPVDDAFYENKSFGPVTTTQNILALDDGRVVLPYAAQESIDDGDMFAYITPPYVEVLMPMGGDGVTPDAYAGIATWPTFAYALTSDGAAADRTLLRGGSGDVKPMALIKQGSGMLPSAMSGTYAYIAFNHDIASNGDRTHSVFTGTLSSNGAGTLGAGTISGVELARIANDSATQTLTGTAVSAALTGGNYSLSDNGSLTLDIETAVNPPPILTGRMNGSGNFFYARAVEEGVQQVVHTSVFGIKVGTAEPTLTGKSYRFRAADLEYATGGYSRYGHLAYSTLEFVDGSNVTVTVNSQEIDRDNDITSIVSHPAVMGEVISGTYTPEANGEFTITLTDGTRIRGYVNAKSMLAIQQRGFLDNGPLDLTNSDAGLGIVMGRCAIGC